MECFFFFFAFASFIKKFKKFLLEFMGFPRGASDKEPTCQSMQVRRKRWGFDP